MRAAAKIAWAGASVAVGLFLWEYLILEWESGLPKPSDGLERLARTLEDLWEFVGYLGAKVSAIFTWIRLEKLFQAFDNLLHPTMRSIFSWAMFYKGYVETVNLYDHPYKVLFGSVVLLCAAAFLVYRYRLEIVHLMLRIKASVKRVWWPPDDDDADNDGKKGEEDEGNSTGASRKNWKRKK